MTEEEKIICKKFLNDADNTHSCNEYKLLMALLEQEPKTEQEPCGEQMDFPDTFDEFAKDYGFKDKDEVYTNGSELIPVFRVKQWLEHIKESQRFADVGKTIEPTIKNDLVVDSVPKTISFKEMMDNLKITAENIKNAEDLEYSIEPLISQ